MGLSGEKLLGEAKTVTPDSDYLKNEPAVAARHAGVALDYFTSSAQRGPMRSTATCRAPTGLWSPHSRGTTGAGC